MAVHGGGRVWVDTFNGWPVKMHTPLLRAASVVRIIGVVVVVVVGRGMGGKMEHLISIF